MEFTNSYDVVYDVIEEAVSSFGPRWRLKDKLAEIEGICGQIDNLIHEFECAYIEARFEDTTLVIEIATDYLLFEEGCTHPFFDLIANVNSFSFFKSHDDLVSVAFYINDLWERVDG